MCGIAASWRRCSYRLTFSCPSSTITMPTSISISGAQVCLHISVPISKVQIFIFLFRAEVLLAPLLTKAAMSIIAPLHAASGKQSGTVMLNIKWEEPSPQPISQTGATNKFACACMHARACVHGRQGDGAGEADTQTQTQTHTHTHTHTHTQGNGRGRRWRGCGRYSH